jgi:hypothetical protein
LLLLTSNIEAGPDKIEPLLLPVEAAIRVDFKSPMRKNTMRNSNLPSLRRKRGITGHKCVRRLRSMDSFPGSGPTRRRRDCKCCSRGGLSEVRREEPSPHGEANSVVPCSYFLQRVFRVTAWKLSRRASRGSKGTNRRCRIGANPS